MFSARFFAPLKAYQSVLAEARKRDPVVDLDDHCWLYPRSIQTGLAGDFADSLPLLMHAMLSADALTVTTPEFSKRQSCSTPECGRAAQLLDKDLACLQPHSSMDAQVRILFMGTPA